MIRLSAGLRDPWIEWDGRIGRGRDAGRVWLDGQPIPVFSTECCWQAHIDDPSHPDHVAAVAEGRMCTGPSGSPAPHDSMLSWSLPLENGALVEAWADGHDSVLIVRTAAAGPHLHERDGVLTYHPDCRGITCEGCWHDVDAVYVEFESRDEYVAAVARLGSLPLHRPGRVA